MIRVILADDHTLVRQGVRGLLALLPDVEVVGEAGGGEEALRLLTDKKPDVALLDVRMPKVSGLDVARRARAAGLAVPILLLTTFDDDEALRAGLDAGVSGFLLKDISLEELADAIRRAAGGERMLGAAVTQRARDDVQKAKLGFDAADYPEPLSPREIEVLRLVARGMSNREIAETLGVAEGTVKNHTSNILSKLGVRDRTRAVLKAIERGVI